VGRWPGETPDAASDLDVLLAVRDDDLEEFAAGWRPWLEAVTPTLIAFPLTFAPGSLTATTIGHLRLDVVTEKVTDLPGTPHRRRVAVLDKDELDGRVPEPAPGAGPDLDRLVAMCTEFLRVEGLTPVVLLERGDRLSAVVGLQLLHGMLVEICAESNRPLPPMGVKRVADRLTPEQQEALLALPPIAADSAHLVAAIRALGAAFRGPVRDAVEAAGALWPADVDDAVGAFVHRSLDAGRVLL
jgi:hypothetical protein